MSDLNLSQIKSEPTHFRVRCLPSCIDLITDQPNPVLSGVRPSLDPTCKHQITFCKINFLMPPPPAYKRKIWHFNKADLPSYNYNTIYFPVAGTPWATRRSLSTGNTAERNHFKYV